MELYGETTYALARPEAFKLDTEQLGEDLSANGVRYAEVTFTAGTHLRFKGMPVDEVMTAIAEGAGVARANWGVEMRFIIDHVRGFPVEDCMQTAEWCRAGAGPRCRRQHPVERFSTRGLVSQRRSALRRMRSWGSGSQAWRLGSQGSASRCPRFRALLPVRLPAVGCAPTPRWPTPRMCRWLIRPFGSDLDLLLATSPERSASCSRSRRAPPSERAGRPFGGQRRDGRACVGCGYGSGPG